VANLTPPYAVELVNYRLNDDADPDAFLAINRTVGEEFTSRHLADRGLLANRRRRAQLDQQHRHHPRDGQNLYVDDQPGHADPGDFRRGLSPAGA
jgi:hypothetical protein